MEFLVSWPLLENTSTSVPVRAADRMVRQL